jgi:hypothetical protein
MSKILITGNGFDLNLGLPTHYHDFIKILNHIEKTDGKVEFSEVYNLVGSNPDILKNIKPFQLDHEKLQLLKSELVSNVWYQFFSNEYELETWIDFEIKIEYVLKILFNSIEKLKSTLFSKGSIGIKNLSFTPDILSHDIELLKVLSKFSIIFLDKEYNVTLNDKFLLKKYDFIIGVDMDKIAKYLHINLNGFKKVFNYYFEIFVSPLYGNLPVEANQNFFSEIDKHYTFNYTPTFDKVYSPINITNYLHGKIDSNLNKIVLGINEVPENSDAKKYYLPFTKYFQKLNHNTDYKFISDLDKGGFSSFMFFFMGHSLDKSDEDYINEIFDFINDSQASLKKIIIIYHNEIAKSKLLLNLLNIRGKIDIQNLMKKDILIFRHLESEELKADLTNKLPEISLITVL